MLLCRYEKQLSTIKELQEKLERLTIILQVIQVLTYLL